MSNEIAKSMRQELWHITWGRTGRSQFDRPRRPDAVSKAARDLASLYEIANNAGSLDALYRVAKQHCWEDEANRPGASGKHNFGRWLVGVALGERVSWMNVPAMPSFQIPTFSVTFDGEHLEWEGSDERRNPTEEDELEHDLGVNHAKHNPWLAPSKHAPSEFDPSALRAGAHVEMEHTDDPQVAQQIAMDHLAEDPAYYTKLSQIHHNPCRCHNPPRKPHDVPHTKTVAEVREILSRIPKAQRCDDICPGWVVSESDRYGTQVEVCDECMTALPKALRLTDEEVAQLPEAKRELAKTIATREDLGAVEVNPSRWPASSVQSLLFDVDRFSPSAAKKWAADHGFHYGKIHTTGRYHHLRQFEPTAKGRAMAKRSVAVLVSLRTRK
jgi:hypothetical protein